MKLEEAAKDAHNRFLMDKIVMHLSLIEKPRMLSDELFREVVSCSPLVSIDFIPKKSNQILLGKRVNPSAKGFWFVPGRRIFKNELIQEAIKRLSLSEFGASLDVTELKFKGIYQHFYQDSIFGNFISTHYVVLAYELSLDWLDSVKKLPKTQHCVYRFFSIDELLQDEEVHFYTKDYFREINNG